jgi:DNA-directed RNA polymerase alpha subunit
MKFVILPSDNGIRFRLSEVDKSVANALRRTLIGNISHPCDEAQGLHHYRK